MVHQVFRKPKPFLHRQQNPAMKPTTDNRATRAGELAIAEAAP